MIKDVRMFRRLANASGIALWALLLGLVPAAAQTADAVLTNARIYTVNEKQPWAEAIAIKGRDIVYVGDNAGAQKFVGDGTKTADLEGRLMLPGLVSGHEHPLVTAAFAAALFIPYSEDKDKMLKAVADYTKERPDAAPMSWGGSYEGRVDITRKDLDPIVGDKPFVMIAASGHGAWISSKALEAAGITKDAKDPVDGIEREKDGTPTGYMSTSAAAMYVVNALGLIKEEAVAADLPKVIADYNAYGFTAVYDAGVPPAAEPTIYRAVHRLEKAGNLNLRISASVVAQRSFHVAGAFERLEQLRPLYTSELFTVNTFKIHGGSPDGHSSPLLEPYSDREGFNVEIWDAKERNEITLRAAKMGINIHTHVMGDRAIRDALNSFQLVREAGLNDVRLSTGHSTMIHPDDAPRYAKYNVTANVFATKNAVLEPTTLKRDGPERLKYWQPMKSLLKNGARLAMSADSPTAPLDPWLQMEVAMLRKEPGMKESLYREEEGLNIAQIIKAYTMGAAYQIGWENIIGSLQVGKRADLVVVDQDVFKVKPEQLHNTKAILTMMNGQVVFRRDASDQ